MLVSPIALPEKLSPSVELAAIQLRDKIYTCFPNRAANAPSTDEVTVGVSITFDDHGKYNGLKVSFLSLIHI